MPSEPAPDLILKNGFVVTGDRDSSVAQAIAVRSGEILAVGGGGDIEALAGPNTKVVDLRSRCVVPGQVDAYEHFVCSGMDLLEDRGKVNIVSLQSVDQILHAIKERVDATPPGEWVATSCMYRGAMKEGRWPNRRDLDQVAPNHPVYVMQGGRPIIANSRALQMAGIGRETPDPTGPAGIIVRDDEGEPTGQLIGGAADLARRAWSSAQGLPPEQWDFFPLDEQAMVGAIVAQQRVFHACGVTAVRDEGTTRVEVRAFVEARRRGLLKTRTGLLLLLPERYLLTDEDCERFFGSYFEPWELGDEWLRVRGLAFCYSLDGWQIISENRLRYFVRECNRRGWSLAITPGIGGVEEVDALLSALEAASAEKPISRRRFSLMHPMGLRRPEDVRRARQLELLLNPNPLLNYYAAARSLQMHAAIQSSGLHHGVASDAWTQTVKLWGMSLRTWFDAGFVVSGGSNTPAAIYDTERPFLGQYAALTGDTLAGVLRSDQGITRRQMLRMFTGNGACALGLEDRIGSLEAGKLADLAVLDRNILTCSDGEIAETKVLQTYVGGQLVHER